MSERKSNSTTTTTDREITATRLLDAPRELVWKMWTQPGHIAHWWGPVGFTNTIHTMDVRPGGTWEFIMHGPDGTDYKNKIVYNEVVEPELLTYSHASYPPFEATVTFANEDGKTRLTMQMVFESAELREKIAQQFKAVEGQQQTLDRLTERLAFETDVVITRAFDAPRELVFKAWTDPAHLAQWWGPKGFTNPRCEVDFRIGGAIRIDMRGPNGVIYPMSGIFREIVKPERLVLTTTALDKEGNVLFESLKTVTFIEKEGKTILTVISRLVSATSEADRYVNGYRAGMTQSLERLDEFLARN